MTNEKLLCHILGNILDNVYPNLEWFSTTPLSARYILVVFFQTKNLTSNRSKPIGVLTRTKSSCSDERLPIGYLLRNFQPNRSNFFAPPPPPPPPALTRKKGGRHVGGAPAPPDVLLRKIFQKFSNISRHVKHSRFFGRFGKTLWSIEKSVRKWTSNRSKPIRVLTPIMKYLQIEAFR